MTARPPADPTAYYHVLPLRLLLAVLDEEPGGFGGLGGYDRMGDAAALLTAGSVSYHPHAHAAFAPRVAAQVQLRGRLASAAAVGGAPAGLVSPQVSRFESSVPNGCAGVTPG